MRAAKESITVPTRSWLLVESLRTVLPFRECIREFLLFWQTKSQLSLSAVGGVVVAEIVVELFRQPAWGSVPAQPIKNFKRGVPGTKDPLDHSGSNSKEEWSNEAAANMHQPAFQALGGVAWLLCEPLPSAFAPPFGCQVDGSPASEKGSAGRSVEVWSEAEAGAAGFPA